MVSFDIESFLKGCIEKRASDIHLKVDEYARLRISGEIYTFNVGKLSYEEMEELILKIFKTYFYLLFIIFWNQNNIL